MTRDRKTGDRPVLYVPRAAASIAGTIQPALLKKHLMPERFETDLASRFLIAEPLEKDRVSWNESEVDPDPQDRCLTVVEELSKFNGDSAGGELKPTSIGLSQIGKTVFVAWRHRHETIQRDRYGPLRAAFAKLKSVPARLGLIFHLVRRTAADRTLETPDRVDGASIRAGVELAEFFGNEIERLYGNFVESPEETEQRRLVAWIRQRGGEITPRNLNRGNRQLKNTDEARAFLQKLVDTNRGQWREDRSAQGGPVSRVFTLT